MELFEVEIWLCIKDGDWKWVYDKGRVMSCDKEGLFVKIVGIYIDIDYWKVVEKVFMESEVFFCSLFEDSLLGILFCNMDGGI